MAQKDPLVEYTQRATNVRGAERQIREEVVFTLFHAELAPEEAGELQAAQAAQTVNGGLAYQHESLAGPTRSPRRSGRRDAGRRPAPASRAACRLEKEKLGRNDPCWCGCGKKFKKCHGA